MKKIRIANIKNDPFEPDVISGLLVRVRLFGLALCW